MRKEDYVRPRLHRMERAHRYGVYFIFKSMEQGRTFRSALPKFPTADPDYPILRQTRSRFTHYDGRRYAYRLTTKGLRVALLFLLSHKRLCGPLANSLFHHRPDRTAQPVNPLEAAYHKADDSIEEIIRLLQAA